jgi:uncharacterized membrane protein
METAMRGELWSQTYVVVVVVVVVVGGGGGGGGVVIIVVVVVTLIALVSSLGCNRANSREQNEEESGGVSELHRGSWM